MPGARVLPGYVRREHDRVLAEAVRDAAAGRSRIVVLVGGSSTGKTRACWEAEQPLANQGWRLWHPFDPARAEAAPEDLHRVQPRTAVRLNEAQHYLGSPHVGERVAAAVHTYREAAEALYRQSADHGNTNALRSLPVSRERAGDGREPRLWPGRPPTTVLPPRNRAPCLAA
ncbi:hypothetical protein ACIBBD_28185 [Streptomyces sp. NPDC051315]|uniref:hypothetical protein n=1 Tax=Streptomyces sp. NPDC051315 TaxID=3365650 RepID=UPI00379F3744